MIYIAHRGIVDGNSDGENSPSKIREALWEGFDVEADIWYLDGKFRLGHDMGQYDVDGLFSESGIWWHAKNPKALDYLVNEGLHCFWHEKDYCALTSDQIIWTYPCRPLLKGSVCVLPEKGYKGDIDSCGWICSKYVREIEKEGTLATEPLQNYNREASNAT